MVEKITEELFPLMTVRRKAIMMEERRKVPLLLWPFWALWQLVGFILQLVGRVLAVVLGMVFILIGILVSLTVVGAIVGIPLALFGLLLMFRGIF